MDSAFRMRGNVRLSKVARSSQTLRQKIDSFGYVWFRSLWPLHCNGMDNERPKLLNFLISMTLLVIS